MVDEHGLVDEATMFADLEEAVSDEELSSVGVIAARQLKLASDVKELESQLDAAKKELRKVETEVLPEAMRSVGLTEVGVGNYRIEIEPVISGSISNRDIERKARALAWMRENGAGDLIKREVKVVFPATEEGARAARALLEFLGDIVAWHEYCSTDPAGPNEDLEPLAAIEFGVDEVESVHAGKLKTWLTQMVEQGVDLPEDDFKLFRGDVAKVEIRIA